MRRLKPAEQSELLRCTLRGLEMFGGEGRSVPVQTQRLAGQLYPPANHPGNRSAAGHAPRPARIVVFAAAGLPDELEDMLVAIGKIRNEPLAKEVAHFQRQPQQ